MHIISNPFLPAPVAEMTAPTLIRKAADVIERHGWLGEYGDALIRPPLDLVAAACEVVAEQPCHPRHLNPVQAEHVAEILDHLESALHMSVSDYRRDHVEATGTEVAWELRIIAYRFEQEMANLAAAA